METEDNKTVRIPRLSASMFGGDRALWVVIVALAIVSLLVVYSSTASMAYKEAGGDTMHYVSRQFIFQIIGFVTIFFVHRVNYQAYAKYTRLLFVCALGLMALTFFVGVDLNDASRWLRIPGTGYTFQPSDFLRVTVVMMLAKALAKKQNTIANARLFPVIAIPYSSLSERQKRKNIEIMRDTAVPLLVPVALACGIIVFSSLSTAMMIFVTCLVMLYVGRVKVRELMKLVVLVMLVGILFVSVMAMSGSGRGKTWINRLKAFAPIEQVDTQTEVDDLQERQAKIAIASGGIIGKGPGNSTQRANLPHSYSDFAYAFIIEEYGLVGGIVVLALYMWLFFRTVMISRKCERVFPSLLVLGLGIMIVMQAFINMMVSVGLFPVTGQTLPLISMGGSSLVFTSLALGMILGISRQMHERSLQTAKEEVSEK